MMDRRHALCFVRCAQISCDTRTQSIVPVPQYVTRSGLTIVLRYMYLQQNIDHVNHSIGRHCTDFVYVQKHCASIVTWNLFAPISLEANPYIYIYGINNHVYQITPQSIGRKSNNTHFDQCQPCHCLPTVPSYANITNTTT
jgi:hypothetical protein